MSNVKCLDLSKKDTFKYICKVCGPLFLSKGQLEGGSSFNI